MVNKDKNHCNIIIIFKFSAIGIAFSKKSPFSYCKFPNSLDMNSLDSDEVSALQFQNLFLGSGRSKTVYTCKKAGTYEEERKIKYVVKGNTWGQT